MEAWSYEHRAVDAPGVAVPPKTVEYRMSYQVRRIGDAWLVQHAAAGGETVKPVGGAR